LNGTQRDGVAVKSGARPDISPKDYRGGSTFTATETLWYNSEKLRESRII